MVGENRADVRRAVVELRRTLTNMTRRHCAAYSTLDRQFRDHRRISTRTRHVTENLRNLPRRSRQASVHRLSARASNPREHKQKQHDTETIFAALMPVSNPNWLLGAARAQVSLQLTLPQRPNSRSRSPPFPVHCFPRADHHVASCIATTTSSTPRGRVAWHLRLSAMAKPPSE